MKGAVLFILIFKGTFNKKEEENCQFKIIDWDTNKDCGENFEREQKSRRNLGVEILGG